MSAFHSMRWDGVLAEKLTNTASYKDLKHPQCSCKDLQSRDFSSHKHWTSTDWSTEHISAWTPIFEMSGYRQGK